MASPSRMPEPMRTMRRVAGHSGSSKYMSRKIFRLSSISRVAAREGGMVERIL